MLVVGAGAAPSIELAQGAGIKTGDGIDVDSSLRTSDADVYSAGDAALFPYIELGRKMRVEHWDNALSQGRLAGENMAGAQKDYDHMPYFFSDLFDFGYEAVGDVSTKLEVAADWQEENKKGVLYYMKDSVVRGVMLCNVWDKVDEARELIRKKEAVSIEVLKGRIR
jgi:NADPH-dependent 2,4-dienoyl-CoA reductase/sulfur reductase-like enzyme